jgi:hypothetical protein
MEEKTLVEIFDDVKKDFNFEKLFYIITKGIKLKDNGKDNI